ncbi:OB-fold nucleic acid binding domain-containing protein [Hahella sp. HN01]|uniref:OB-fold nucleic acid binding domain-containing protein n=1 Tax=Hahella sp. HN01 TaxID=2847262 RepID=UPI0020A69710|nr:OB-fold nucleic acid binding domain-containing protein [Hahella sp. HN01]
MPTSIKREAFDYDKVPTSPKPLNHEDTPHHAHRVDIQYPPHCLTAVELLNQKAGLKTHVAGVVINRQRPKTSTGVTFLTLEDETGSINIIVWKKTAMAQMDALVKSRLLMVYGEIDKDDEGRVAHVIAHRLIDMTPHLEGLESPSRDFH